MHSHDTFFKLESEFTPRGDQPQAIDALCRCIDQGVSDQILLGVTGSGKTFSVANVIAHCKRPALIMAPNKTLAAQLYSEFKALFPHNAVEYFVSYYDYYQPEAYLPHSDTYIEKDSSINEDIDKLRHAATHALFTRRDVIIVASVSCIYGLGSPEYYAKMLIPMKRGDQVSMESIIERLVEVQYERNDYDLHRGTFRVRGDILEIIPAYEHEQALRIEFFGDEIEGIFTTDPLTGKIMERLSETVIYPASHYVSDRENLNRAMHAIRDDLRDRLIWFRKNNRLVEAQRLEQKTQLDLEMIEELGYCNGIENYSLHLDKRNPGEPPATLLDYFPKDFLLFVDESHITIPQIGGMFKGDRSRKQTLVDFGFRLPCALDNRPLCFEEFLDRTNQTVYVSATPGPWELKRADGHVTEQVIRPTGLLDPLLEVRQTRGQMDDLMTECFAHIEADERVLVTTLTKRMAEDLTEFLQTRGIAARYMHSDIDTLERVAILRGLQEGEFSVLVGINLLREGLDLPEVSLVAILDADKEGFLRSSRSLIQTFGRAARNVNGKVIMYADKVTGSMQHAMEESNRRREKQHAYNVRHGIVPTTIRRTLVRNVLLEYRRETEDGHSLPVAEIAEAYKGRPRELEREVKRLEKRMRLAAKDLEFELAAQLRDRIATLKEQAKK